MGLLGSAFGRGLAGASAAGASIANRYIDEQLATQRAQAFADIQRTNAGKIREDDDAFRNDPTRLARNRGTARDDAVSVAETARQQAPLNAQSQQEIELSKLQNTPLIEAARNKKAGDDKADAAAKTAQTIADANNPELLSAVGKVKLADPEIAARIAASRASAASSGASAGLAREQTEGVKLSNGDKRELNKLYGSASEILSDASIDDAERGKQFAKVQQQITLIKSKTGLVKERNPELDIETVEILNPDGSKTIRKQVRRPGAGGDDAADPYAVPRRGDKPAAAADPYSPRPAAKPAAKAPPSADSAAANELRQARAELNGFGSRQRQQDPDGFSRAQRRVAQAEQTLEKAVEVSEGPVPAGSANPAFRYAAP